ncbi:cytoplasmic trehalase [Klebsiella pneumoniae subsp. rhinoscleromatis]|nr:cytoplasmic trehalase [Klebsiella pneumoniae subsp. rhinoscleromatis]
MADNFAWLIETYGHIPNGNRTYYLSRSQPPVFALMVELFEEDGVRGAKRYLDHLKMEHAFWMDGAESLIPHQAYRHVVRMPDGSLLNRYWDDRDTPRDESWREDVETARHSGRPANEVYRDLRAGAASGWDYSSRWLRDITRLASIRTTQFIPIDLNAFLFKLETTIANLSGLKGDRETEAAFRQKAQDPLGDEIAWSWLQTVNHFYKQHHKLIEKYHIATGVPHEGGGGEYPLQDGFGWTNGVVRRLIGLYGEPT